MVILIQIYVTSDTSSDTLPMTLLSQVWNSELCLLPPGWRTGTTRWASTRAPASPTSTSSTRSSRTCPRTGTCSRVQGGPSGRGTLFVDIKFKVPSQYKLPFSRFYLISGYFISGFYCIFGASDRPNSNLNARSSCVKLSSRNEISYYMEHMVGQ